MSEKLRLIRCDPPLPGPEQDVRAENEGASNECLPSPVVMKLDRRSLDRWPAQGTASAVCVGGERFGQMHELRLQDCSEGGLGAVSDTVLEPGTMVSVGFQSPGRWPRRGVVLRCQPCGDGYRVAVQFSLRQAA